MNSSVRFLLMAFVAIPYCNAADPTGVSAEAQQAVHSADSAVQQVGQEAKEAGKQVAEGAKKVASDVADAAKKTGKDVADGARKAGSDAEKATKSGITAVKQAGQTAKPETVKPTEKKTADSTKSASP